MNSDRPLYAQTGETRYDTLLLLRLVVVNVAKEVVGLVSLDNMLRLLGEEQQAIAGLMRAARSRNAQVSAMPM